jgi:hypothetical protein
LVEALAAEGLLVPGTEERARAVLDRRLRSPNQPPVPTGAVGLPRLVEVVAYLGGALVLAAGFLFVAQSWDDLGDVGQVAFLAIVALVLGIAGAVTTGGRTAPRGDLRRRLAGTLLTGAALASGLAVGVAIELSTDPGVAGVSWPLVAGGVVFAAGSAVAYRFASTALGLIGMIGGLVAAASEVAVNAAGVENEALASGSAFVGIGVLWILATERGAFDQCTVARVLGLALALAGGQAASFNAANPWIGYLIMLAIAAGGVGRYVVRLDWPYLAAAVIAVTLVVPEAVSDWTDGSLGVVGGVLVAGVTLLAASFAGYRLRKETTD